MAQKTLHYYYTKARKEGWALAQFNWSSAEQLKGIVAAAVKLRSPLLLGTSEGDSGFVGLKQAVALVQAYREETGLPIFLNLDHGKSFEYIKKGIDAGYDAVHFDGSHLPFMENVATTKKVVAYARKKGISVVEGELGKILGHSTMHKEATIVLDESGFAKPEEAERFVKNTKVDSLAITFGNVHGVYRKMPQLDLERLKKIQKRVQSFLILHGGSGIGKQQILKAIRLGIVKINVSTELRFAFAQTLREVLKKNPEEITPYKFFPPVVKAVQTTAEEKIKLIGSANKI